MALGATIYTFDVDLADADRTVFESLVLRVARHPSETEEYLVARVLAYALEFTEGIEFSRGLADPDEPAILIRDLTGAVRHGSSGPPMRRGSTGRPRPRREWPCTRQVPARLVSSLAGERIHRVDALELYALDRGLVTGLAARLERRMTWSLSVSERELYLSTGGEMLTGPVSRLAIG